MVGAAKWRCFARTPGRESDSAPRGCALQKESTVELLGSLSGGAKKRKKKTCVRARSCRVARLR